MLLLLLPFLALLELPVTSRECITSSMTRERDEDLNGYSGEFTDQKEEKEKTNANTHIHCPPHALGQTNRNVRPSPARRYSTH